MGMAGKRDAPPRLRVTTAGNASRLTGFAAGVTVEMNRQGDGSWQNASQVYLHKLY
jgi:hypothetical protein